MELMRVGTTEATRSPRPAPTFLPDSSLGRGPGPAPLAVRCHGYRASDGASNGSEVPPG